jgi:squalene-associated FAD-dependent desaturase
VIGGGFAGLAAATALAEQGVSVHVFEARPTLGGRANAFRDPVTGERIDNGQHVLAGCYSETLTFLRRLGTHRHLHRPSALRVAMIDERGWRTELVCPALPAPFNLLAGILAWDALTISERGSVVRVGRGLRGPGSVRRGETVRAWLARHHQSPRLCRLFWEPLALAALNQSIDDAAADMFVAVTSRMFGEAPDAAALLVPSVPLDDLYALPAASYVRKAGGEVTTQAKGRVLVEANRVLGVRVGDRDYPGSPVVCAVPWFAFADVFEPPPAVLQDTVADAAALASSPIVSVNLWIDQFRSPDAMLGLPGRNFQWLFDRQRYLGRTQSHVTLVSSGAAPICAATNDELINMALSELRAALPDARRAPLRHASVIRERRATFSLEPGSPPRPKTITPIDGLVLAGDWIDTGLPATIEGAVIAGHQAAAEALRYIRERR